MWSSIQVLPNQVSKNCSIRLKILTYKSPMQSYIKDRVELSEQIQFKGHKSVSTVFVGPLTDFHCIFHSVRLQSEKYIYSASKRVLTERYWPIITNSK